MRGRFIERMLADPALPTETKNQNEKRMETESIEKTPYYIRVPDPRGEVPEPWLAAASARVEAAAERIGLDVTYLQREDDDHEIDWVTHAVEKGVRYNTRQWEMWLRREAIPAVERSTHA